jgi:hypothetical protein
MLAGEGGMFTSGAMLSKADEGYYIVKFGIEIVERAWKREWGRGRVL